MMVVEVEPHSSESKKNVFVEHEDNHTLYEEIDLVSLVVESISSWKDQSIVKEKEMSEPYILLDEM